jgi:predicted alpha/beta-fold hydrolase
LVQSEIDDSPVADLRKIMIRMFNKLTEELKKNMQKQLNEYQENRDKSREDLKQLNELRKFQQDPK